MLHLLHWQLSPYVFPCTPTCLLGQPGLAAIRLCCLAGRGRPSQLSWPSLSPIGEAPVRASSKRSISLAGSSAPCHNLLHTHPTNPTASTIAAWQAEDSLPTTIQAEVLHSTQRAHRGTYQPLLTEIGYCQQIGRKVVPPTAHQQQLEVHHKVEQGTGESKES